MPDESAKFDPFFTFFYVSYPPEPNSWFTISKYISTFVENCFTDKVSLSSPPSYYHFFGFAIVSSRNRVFFRTFLLVLSIHKMSVRHSKIIYISGIKQRKILCFTSFFLYRYQVFHSDFIFPPNFFPWCYHLYKVIKWFYTAPMTYAVSTFDHFLII